MKYSKLLLIFLIVSCSKDIEKLPSNVESTNTLSLDIGSYPLPCPNGQAKIKSASNLNNSTLFAQAQTSISSNWNDSYQKYYGKPYYPYSIEGNLGTSEAVFIPVYHSTKKEISAVITSTTIDGKLLFKFTSKNVLKGKEKQNSLSNSDKSYRRLMSFFEYQFCLSNSFPDEDPANVGIDGPCYTQVDVFIYVDKCCYALQNNDPEIRNDWFCCGWNSYTIGIEVPCPPGGGGGGGSSGTGGTGDTGGTGGTGGTSGTGGNGGTGAPGGTNGGGGSGSTGSTGGNTGAGGANNGDWNDKLRTSIDQDILGYLSRELSPNGYNRVLDLLLTDPSQTCVGVAPDLMDFIQEQNFSEGAISAANCTVLGLNIDFNQGNPDYCTVPNIREIFFNDARYINSNFLERVQGYGVLYDRMCDIYSSNIPHTEINKIGQSVLNFLDPYNVHASLGTPGSNQDLTQQRKVERLFNLILEFPDINLTQAQYSDLLNSEKMEFLTLIRNSHPSLPMNGDIVENLVTNQTLMSEVNSFLNGRSSLSESRRNIGYAVTSSYILGAAELQGTNLEAGSGDPTSPIYSIMKEILIEAIKEQLRDIIPGATLLTIGPQVLADFQDGNYLSALTNAVEIVMNEADVLFPAAKIWTFAVGMTVSAKQIKKVYDAFDHASSLGKVFIQKLYNLLRIKLNFTVNDIRNNFVWLGSHLGAKLKNIDRETFFNKVKEEFVATPAGFNDFNLNPVFKLMEVPEANLSIYAVLYKDSAAGFMWTIGFYMGPNNANNWAQLSTRFKIRFDY